MVQGLGESYFCLDHHGNIVSDRGLPRAYAPPPPQQEAQAFNPTQKRQCRVEGLLCFFFFFLGGGGGGGGIFFWCVFFVFSRKTACSLHFGWIPCHFLRFPQENLYSLRFLEANETQEGRKEGRKQGTRKEEKKERRRERRKEGRKQGNKEGRKGSKEGGSKEEREAATT